MIAEVMIIVLKHFYFFRSLFLARFFFFDSFETWCSLIFFVGRLNNSLLMISLTESHQVRRASSCHHHCHHHRHIFFARTYTLSISNISNIPFSNVFCHHNPPFPPPFRKVISPYQLICHHHPPHHNHHPPHHNHHHCHHNFQTKSQPTPSPTTMEPPATAGKTQDLDQKPEILLRCLLVMIIMVMIKIIMIIP